jgi:uncharacterized LabA/DUF88 family protein
MIFMESEHEQMTSSQPESDTTDTQDAVEATPEQTNQPEEPSAAESAQSETGARTHRRRRSTRSHRAATPESGSEEAEHEAEHAEPEAEATAPTWEAWTSAPAAAEAPSAPETEAQPAAANDESTWGFQQWREQPPTDWNPFLAQTPEPAPFTFSIEPTDATSDLEATTWSSPASEAVLEGNAEVIDAIPAELVTPAEPEQRSNDQPETVRAPLSGVEVRPPRRYRFDRPNQAAREAPPREAPKATPQPTPQQRPQPSEPPRAPHTTHRGRSTPPAAEKEAAETPADHTLGESIEREMTETPEIEADVVAAEELARATQAALEEEVAEALEGFTAASAQATSQRTRRRRRRSGSSAPTPAAAEPVEKPQPTLPQPTPPPAQPPQPYYAPAPAPAAQEYQVANGLQQLNQPQSPFSGPEPSSARGFGPVPRGVAMPAERGVRMPRPERTVETSSVSSNQLAMIFTQAIQQQTDRLLMELRRSQGTPSMTVNFPPMPSNERIGVFVDVANLLYSARNMRIAIDFGRLLDFLRGSRRLVRAHAYCPTSPDPRAEQMFLDAVKGLGYRITTKNYKTFSSGAKKADLDLDLCMDIVRLVDSGAVDCISLVSGDSDFLPLLEYCSDHGVRVEVAAFDEATASILRQSCDLFINLSMVEEIRA